MASFIQTNEVANGALTPTSAEGITKDGWGIDAVLNGFIIQNANVTCSRITDPTQDQKGAVISELDYDQQWNLTLDVIGNPGSGSIADFEDAQIGVDVGDTAFSWNGHTWKVDSVTYQGSFQDKKRYQITAHRYKNFPASGS